jgi:hypothetical protein
VKREVHGDDESRCLTLKEMGFFAVTNPRDLKRTERPVFQVKRKVRHKDYMDPIR